MNAETVLVAIIVLGAVLYLIWSCVKSFRRLSKNIGPCGHCCDNCPFAKYSQGTRCCHTHPNMKKK